MNPGHMSPPATSAFDPLFWLHHSNVDRQIALFQALFLSTYVERCTAKESTWTIQPGESLDAQSPLTPFHRASGEWWTSASSKNIVDLGYTYPELLDTPSNETLISRINSLYRDSRLASKNTKLYPAVQEVEYIVQVTMPISAKSSYNVVVFLGDMHDNPAKWTSQDSFVAKTSSLMAMTAQSSSTTVGTVLLNGVVAKNLANSQMQQEEVSHYLKTNLHWRLELGDVEIPRSEVPGVKVTLMSTKIERATTISELDRWVGGFTVLGEIA
ncbi:hypothetical protein BU23DRAFT_551365 [Bimuria novae-zelandiae CBS 107.79]|uniref:tyrosinase n=1 Tax=Bimuria novae-zelandiae CBS 107.79 TaxID=1447943 RepID=A0A6A5VUN3_9PLEO|nr:hypothetical protein BU23DRAFT_551365 [Bimuria novae-zelandiae CBS 107.79]